MWRASRFEVVALNVARRWVQIGAVWEAAMKCSGEVFLAGTIDDPSLPEPLPVALFPAADFDGYMVAWRRDTMRSDFAGGGFGASNYDTESRGERGGSRVGHRQQLPLHGAEAGAARAGAGRRTRRSRAPPGPQ